MTDDFDLQLDSALQEAVLASVQATKTIAEYINANPKSIAAFEQALKCHQAAQAAATLLNLLHSCNATPATDTLLL